MLVSIPIHTGLRQLRQDSCQPKGATASEFHDRRRRGTSESATLRVCERELGFSRRRDVRRRAGGKDTPGDAWRPRVENEVKETVAAATTL